MTLESGSKLGPYEIEAPLGAGGMGEVYRARDTRLDRTVAIKVLPGHLSNDSGLRQRLEREAKALSSLSHPNICGLFDIGQQEGVDFLVMEFLEGESLAERIGRGALPVDEVTRYGIQIAEALDKAHRAGVVHRDLKPGNVMLTKTGAKLLDFGLARAELGAVEPSELSSTPTMSRPLTQAGTIVGTFQYMAPEQLEGKEADARSDLFAFGAVLHEMATGKKAFSGASQASLIASIMHDQPPSISAVQPMVPPALDRVVRACLAKDPEERWQTAHDVLMELKWVAEGGSQVGVPAPVAARRRTRERMAWAAFAVAALAAVALGVGYARRAPQPADVVKFQIETPAEFTSLGSPRVSPNGRLVAFDATDSSGVHQLWVRPLDALEARAVSGTEGSGRPFWSPDGKMLAFFSGGKLRKVDVAGGPSQSICDAATGSDGTWGADGVILFDGRGSDPILRVPASGGVPKPEVTGTEDRGPAGVGWPEFLPDGRRFLYVAIAQKTEESQVFVRELDKDVETPLFNTTSRVQYAPPGYLLYVREESLVAQPFDVGSLKTTGEPVPVAEGLGTDAVGLAHFSASTNRVLAYRAGQTRVRQLVWVDRTGREGDHVGEDAEYGDSWPSPDGHRLVFDMPEPRSSRSDLWIRDLDRGVTSRFTFDPADDSTPVWSPDGKRIVFTSNRAGAGDLYVKAASGAGQEEVLLTSDEEKYAQDWSRDGRYVLYTSRNKETRWDIWALPMDKEKAEPFPVVKTQFSEIAPSLSPDGRYVAYVSFESGSPEVYVQEFPEALSKWQISTAGGAEPFWRADGKEMFYLAQDSQIMAVPLDTGKPLTVGAPRALFRARLQPANQRAHYRPSPDGQRFLTLAPLGRESILPTTVIVNWTRTLRN